MTDQELFAYKQGRANVLNDATRANAYQMRDAQEPADLLLREAIQHFGRDMYNKALLARDKYDFHPMGWVYPDWQEELQRQMAEHVLKGDPRDTGWLSTIAWYHGWRTAAATPPAPVATGGAAEALQACPRYRETMGCFCTPTTGCSARSKPAPADLGRFSNDLETRLPDAFTNAIGLLEHLNREDVARRLQSVAASWFAELKGLRAASLQATTAAAEAAPLGGWVAVKSVQGCPRFGSLALVYVLEHGEHQEIYNSIQVAERTLDPHSRADWFTHNGERVCSAISQPYGVTHWQPLPTPPTAPAHAAQ